MDFLRKFLKSKACFYSLLFIFIIFLGLIIGNTYKEVSQVYLGVYNTTINGAKLTTYPEKVFSDSKIIDIIYNSTATDKFKEIGHFKYSIIANVDNQNVEIKIMDNGEIVIISNLVPQNGIFISESEFNKIVEIMEK